MAKERNQFKGFNENRQRAQQYADKLQELLSNSEDKNSRIEELLSRFSKNVDHSEQVKNELIAISEEVSISNANIDGQKEIIENQRSEIDLFYNEFNEVKKRVLDPSNGMEVSLNDAIEVRNKLKAFEAKSTSLNVEFEKKVDDYTKRAVVLDELQGKISDLFSKASNEEDGVKIQLDRVKAIREEVVTTYDRIKEFEENVSSIDAKIKTLHKNSHEKSEEINNLKDKASDTYKEIERIYGQTADTGMAGEFAKRRDEYKKEIDLWSSRISRVTLYLFIVIVLLFLLPYFGAIFCGEFCEITITPDFYLRLAITSPIVYYLYFVAKKHKKATESYRKYAFKTTLAFSIKNHIDLLARHEKFDKPEHSNQVLDWAISALDKIYDEPYFDEGKKMKYKIMLEEIKYGVRETSPIEKEIRSSGAKSDNEETDLN